MGNMSSKDWKELTDDLSTEDFKKLGIKKHKKLL